MKFSIVFFVCLLCVNVYLKYILLCNNVFVHLYNLVTTSSIFNFNFIWIILIVIMMYDFVWNYQCISTNDDCAWVALIQSIGLKERLFKSHFEHPNQRFFTEIWMRFANSKFPWFYSISNNKYGWGRPNRPKTWMPQ